MQTNTDTVDPTTENQSGLRPYDVTVQRTEYREHVFRVMATDPEDAQAKGLEASSDYNFLDSPVDHADEDVTSTVEAS